MDIKEKRKQLRERYVLALMEATFPLQKEAEDPEVTLEELIEAAEVLKEHLQSELQQWRQEQD